jgi:hypothetical protein
MRPQLTEEQLQPMGSTGGSRNKTDRSPLRSLRSERGHGGGGVGGAAVGGGDYQQGGLVCEPSFFVELKQLPILKKGLALTLKDDGRVFVLGTEVGKLTARQYAMVKSCREDGVVYRGTVAQRKRDGKDDFYGDFRKVKK